MEIRFLEHFDLIDLHQTFLEAFSDYLIPMQLSRDQFQQLLKRRGARNDISVGVFESSHPVGFTINALEDYQSIPTVYDVVTGIIPLARRRGLAKQMFDFGVPRLKEFGARRYVLEVFENNLPAVQLYEKIGFSASRKLEVFTRNQQRGFDPANFEIKGIDPQWELFQSFWDWEPSWQNSIASIQRSDANKYIAGVYKDSKVIGYGIIFPESGDIPQFAVDRTHRRGGAGRRLLDHLQARVPEGKTVRVVNVDGAAEGTTRFLRQTGFGLLGRQNEMVMKF